MAANESDASRVLTPDDVDSMVDRQGRRSGSRVWRDLYRPFELHARASEWHPDRIDSDHARPRWPERLDAWTRAIALCERIGAA